MWKIWCIFFGYFVLFFWFSSIYCSCCNFFLNWIFYFNNNFLLILLIKIFGSIISLFSLCGLVEFFFDDFYCCFSGGLIGYLLRSDMLYIFNDIIMNISFLFFFILGIFLLSTDQQFFKTSIKNEIIRNILKISKIRILCWIKNIRVKISQSIYIVQKMCLYINHLFYANIFTCKFFAKNIRKIYDNGKNYCISRYVNFIDGLLLGKFRMRNLRIDDIHLNNIQPDIYKSNYRNHLHYIIKSCIPKKYVYKDLKSITCNGLIKKSIVNTTKFLSKQKFSKERVDLFPSIDLLSSPQNLAKSLHSEIIKEQSKLLESKLANYRIQARVVNVLQGPVVTRFELDLAPGLKSSRISNLSRDLARSLSVCSLRIIDIIPGKPYIGLEIPNQKREIVYLREILDTKKFQKSCGLILAFGKDVSGSPIIADLRDMPHLLIAGTTGSGKSVGINSMIISILYKASPENVRFIMIDPKILELSVYDGIPHLVTNVVTNINDVIDILNWCIKEMDRRYKIMASCGARNLNIYNHRFQLDEINKSSMCDSRFSKNVNKSANDSSIFLEKLPYIVIVVDEFADLVISGGKEVELLIIRLSQKARACGMHLILATQRPSVNVITGLIKANIPSRIAFSVSSKVDSRTILDRSGAESLLGKGDMLYLGSNFSVPIRVHGAFVSDEEISLIVKHWKCMFN